ncbi:hypothetical protein CRG98_044775 [Punica granatum]|uniref:Uncharacterized protein n=1 Tax=Punica granatum TaxID=22663 RepID=A0A2I0HT06_PUNGR|nr:hypothetical protein CRG98_044775 [Punica granatum]
MAREIARLVDSYGSGSGSGGVLFVLCAVVFSLTVISMVVFACGHSSNGSHRRRRHGGGGGGGCGGGGGGGGCGGGGGGGC